MLVRNWFIDRFATIRRFGPINSPKLQSVHNSCGYPCSKFEKFHQVMMVYPVELRDIAYFAPIIIYLSWADFQNLIFIYLVQEHLYLSSLKVPSKLWIIISRRWTADRSIPIWFDGKRNHKLFDNGSLMTYQTLSVKLIINVSIEITG